MISSGNEVTGIATAAGLLPTFLMEGDAKFQLMVKEIKMEFYLQILSRTPPPRLFHRNEIFWEFSGLGKYTSF